MNRMGFRKDGPPAVVFSVRILVSDGEVEEDDEIESTITLSIMK